MSLLDVIKYGNIDIANINLLIKLPISVIIALYRNSTRDVHYYVQDRTLSKVEMVLAISDIYKISDTLRKNTIRGLLKKYLLEYEPI